MRYGRLRRRVASAERRFERSLARTQSDWDALVQGTQRSMTPLRVVIGGFVSGFLLGVSAPLSRLGGGMRVLQIAERVLTLLGSLAVVEAAEEVADTAETQRQQQA
jgi:hypothetical protein